MQIYLLKNIVICIFDKKYSTCLRRQYLFKLKKNTLYSLTHVLKNKILFFTD